MKGQLKLLGGQRIKSPNGLNTRPTTALVREALRNILGNALVESSFLDLFSGSGIISCEAIQGGAGKVVSIELDRKTAQICNSNLIRISKDAQNNSQFRSINSEVLKWLKGGHTLQKEKYKNLIPKYGFDFVYLDPPYKNNMYSAVLNNLILGKWINNQSFVICESDRSMNIELSDEWKVKDSRCYGKTRLTFLTPSQELNFLYDIDSKH